jgi:hypothetical protein
MENKREFVNLKVKKVFLIHYIPLTESGESLDLHMGWNDPSELIQQYMDSIYESSRHTYKYEIVKQENFSEMTELIGNFVYPLNMLKAVVDGKEEPRSPMHIDYGELMRRFEIPLGIASRVYDEVWLMGYPYAGFYEAVMGGPNALWLTGPAIPDTNNSLRRFVVMGFDYSKDLGGMLEAFIHRAEAIMFNEYDGYPSAKNMWKRFTAIDKTSPQNAGIGTAHYAPNSLSDYDWNNSRYVMSNCDDWNTYPNLKGKVTTVNATEWGNGSRIKHHEWWLKHLPHGVGKTDGVFNNWFHYIMTPDWCRR